MVGYYGFLAQKFREGTRLVGVDRDKEDIERCKTMAHHLKSGPATFFEDDVYHFVENSDKFDLILCAGGLYHLPDPRRLLEGLRKITKQYLVVQSAITVEHDDPDYFERPNPWFKTWGSLFTNRRLLRWLDEAGFEVVESAVNSREHPNPDYVGACYALVK